MHYVGLSHYLGLKILNFNIFFQNNEYFLGCEDFVDIFWGSSQNWTCFGEGSTLSLFLKRVVLEDIFPLFYLLPIDHLCRT